MRRLDRTQEDDELQVGDVDAGGQQVDGDNDLRVRAVAELADPLQGSVDSAGDLRDEGVAAAEDVAAELDELVGVGGVRQVVGGEDEGLGEPAGLRLVLVGVALRAPRGSCGWSRER